MQVQINRATIRITEQSLKEIIRVADAFKETFPNSEAVRIESAYSPVNFVVELETQPNTQESLGFKIHGGEKCFITNADED